MNIEIPFSQRTVTLADMSILKEPQRQGYMTSMREHLGRDIILEDEPFPIVLWATARFGREPSRLDSSMRELLGCTHEGRRILVALAADYAERVLQQWEQQSIVRHPRWAILAAREWFHGRTDDGYVWLDKPTGREKVWLWTAANDARGVWRFAEKYCNFAYRSRHVYAAKAATYAAETANEADNAARKNNQEYKRSVAGACDSAANAAVRAAFSEVDEKNWQRSRLLEYLLGIRRSEHGLPK